MTDIYLHIVARMADYMDTHPRADRLQTTGENTLQTKTPWLRLAAVAENFETAHQVWTNVRRVVQSGPHAPPVFRYGLFPDNP